MIAIIAIGLVLILVFAYLMFRISNLLDNLKKTDTKHQPHPEGTNTRHGLYFMLFAVAGLVLFFWYSFKYFPLYNLPLASKHGVETDYLFWVTMAITVVAFVIIFIVMFWFTYKYSYQNKRKAAYYVDNKYLEMIWTIVPAIVLTVLIFGGLRTWGRITSAAEKGAEEIELVGQQFFWAARYPGKDKELGQHNFRMIDPTNEFGLDLTDKKSFDDFKSLTLHLPKGKEVLLRIRAKDVIHSVFLPHFRVKMDAVPGMQTAFKFTPTKTTEEMRKELNKPDFNYEMACAEICGKGHFSMRFPVVVEEPSVYEKWKSQQESWLKQNPEYLQRVPPWLKDEAKKSADLDSLIAKQ